MKLALIAIIIACKILSGFDAPGETVEDEMPVSYHVVKCQAAGLASASQQIETNIQKSIASSGKV